MVNPLQSLLGMSQVVSAAPDPLAVPEAAEAEPEIVVDASRNDPYRFENPSDVTARDLGVQSGEEAADRRGMFGVKGTLRDVLGLVGDAFLIQSGNDPIYQAKRQQERVSDAMAGFTEDPIAAIERVGKFNPDAAAKMHEAYLMNQYRTGQNTNAALRAQTDANKEGRMGREGAMDYVSQAYAAAVASGDPAALAKAEELAGLVSKQYQIPLADLGVTPGMSVEDARVLAGRSATTNQNLRLPQYERGLDLREEAEEGRNRRAAQAEGGRNARARAAEAGRERRSIRTDNRVRELDDGGRGSGPRQLRGSEGSPSSSLRIRPVG